MAVIELGGLAAQQLRQLVSLSGVLQRWRPVQRSQGWLGECPAETGDIHQPVPIAGRLRRKLKNSDED